jgi:hypothetical protein
MYSGSSAWISSLDVSISKLTKPSVHMPRGMRSAAPPRSTGSAALTSSDNRQREKSNAAVRSPAPARTPGSGSRSKRFVMSFRIDVVSYCV